ncbi:MAG TPA: cysteine--tRNA ligase [Phycisphaerae bacterium]
MPLRVYNTLTKQKEIFEPVVPGKVGIYLCGPTVYKPSHIGHAVGPIIFDALKRFLIFKGFQVTWVVNITDVEDKLIAEARAQGVRVPDLAARVTANYLDAMQRLGVRGIDQMPKVSEHIPDILGMIQKLIDRKHAYVSRGDVYFDVTSDLDYGKLSNRSPDEQAGQRELVSGEKRHPGDFALWKAAKPEEPPETKHESPWGLGRPGWHIECSAMSCRILGETFDIHGGGMDLVFPHHENEIAQSESATGRLFAKYWLHHGLTKINTKKISKSETEEGALAKLTLSNLLATYPGELLRYFVLGTHYRSPIDFSDEALEAKRKGLDTFYRLFERVERVTGASAYGDTPALERVAPETIAPEDREFASAVLAQRTRLVEALDDDFNTAVAIAVLFELANAINRFVDERKLESAPSGPARLAALAATRQCVELARLLGLFEAPPAAQPGMDNELVEGLMGLLIELRQCCRKSKNFELADLIRTRLSELNVTLEDRPDGTIWRRS